MPSNPVPQDFDRPTLRREVDEKVQRFLDGASTTSFPAGGETKRNNAKALNQAIFGLAKSPEAIYAVRGEGNLRIGEVAAVCFVGSQGVILLKIFYRTERNAQQVYEYALCYQRRGRSPVTWTDAKEFYRTYARRQSAEAPDLEIDMAKARQSAEELVGRLKTGRRDFNAKGALLSGSEVEDQIKSLNVVFELEEADARRANPGSYRVVGVVLDATGLNLRVFRHDSDGWARATYTLDLSYSRPHAQHRGRRGNIEQYHWLNA